MPILNRRETLTLGATGLAGLTLPARSRAGVALPNSPTFPEPKINRLMRGMRYGSGSGGRGINRPSRRSHWMRKALLNALDDYRAWESAARGGDPEAIPGIAPPEWYKLRENISSMVHVVQLTRCSRKSDKLFQDIAGSLRLCPCFGQVPPDYSDHMLEHIPQIAKLERAIAKSSV